MIEQGEALLAVVGLPRVIAGHPPTPAQVAESTQLEAGLEDAVVAFLRGKRRSPPAVKLTELPDSLPEGGHDAIGNLEGEVAVGYGVAAARALAYLNDLIPPRALPGLTARTADRTDAEQAKMRRVLQAVADPMGVFGDLDAMADDQVEAVRAVFPTLWSALALGASEAMAKEDRDLTGREERVLGRILGVSVADVTSLQALHEPEPQEQQGQPPRSGPPSSLATPMQELAAK